MGDYKIVNRFLRRRRILRGCRGCGCGGIARDSCVGPLEEICPVTVNFLGRFFRRVPQLVLKGVHRWWHLVDGGVVRRQYRGICTTPRKQVRQEGKKHHDHCKHGQYVDLHLGRGGSRSAPSWIRPAYAYIGKRRVVHKILLQYTPRAIFCSEPTYTARKPAGYARTC